jgi:hypothetical protein
MIERLEVVCKEDVAWSCSDKVVDSYWEVLGSNLGRESAVLTEVFFFEFPKLL